MVHGYSILVTKKLPINHSNNLDFVTNLYLSFVMLKIKEFKQTSIR